MRVIKNYNSFINENVQSFEYNNMIDYTLLDNSASDEDIISLCENAMKYGVKSVCVMPKHVSLASEELEDSNVLVCTVISFPEGINSLEQKISETNKVISDGADEVDMVLNYKMLDSDEYDYLVSEVKSLVDICHESTNKDGDEIILKVIVESGLLNEEQTEMATLICLDAEADFIKTSTGKVAIGAELDKVKIMFDTIKESGKQMKIKASGGVRTLQDIKTFEPYVDRFGMGSAAVDTLNGNINNDSSY